MSTIKRFEDLEIWQEARALAKEILKIIFLTNLKNDYKLRDQIKGSSGSAMDNIAEGFDRDGNMEFRQFLSIAKGSAGETRSQLYRVFDSGYITEIELNDLVTRYINLSKRISAFINYLNKKEYKGIKYKG
ncbi:four helix bundle protein [Galbibacter sp. BG1]|uniref:four helix bundle protein n=1 Tax=Galbibacter sp. BG1 TaxID=1170699 RepID=UPI0015BDED2A|nr:four helix bundle protein [Galbibacter sp. BG1]QLE01089.1 four helix bundle protein [Galbibacter sp. BG1]